MAAEKRRRKKLKQNATLPTREDAVLFKLDPGPRYQHVPDGNGGLTLVDLWVKTSSLLEAARFNPDQDNEYHLFTRQYPSISQPLVLGNAGLLASTNFDSSKRTVVIIHGWLNSVTSTVNRVLVPAFLEGEDVNVIVVDWNAGAGTSDYEAAVLNVVTSGRSVARFIDWLISASGQDPANYHVIGHSLGGHKAGIVSRNVNGNIGYVTALDPAGPSWYDNSQRFAPNDGAYTEVIYSNSGEWGHTEPFGMVTFYPNGGNFMPGCGTDDDGECNHDRAFYYMAESLRTGGFTGVQCASAEDALAADCNLPGRLRMGGTRPKTGATGIFYLRTNAAPPFSQG